jgi:hypothetical protein
MSISNDNRIAGPFIGNDTTTVLPFSFKVFAATDLAVTKTNISAGKTTTLFLNSDYTVALNSDQDSAPGGSVTLSVALASGYTSIVTSSLANLQPTVLTNLGGFFPSVLNDALDRVTILIQQLASKIGNAIRAPLSDGDLDMILPSASLRAGYYLAFDADGLPIATGGDATVAVSSTMEPVVQASSLSSALSLLGGAPLASPALTGTPTAPTASAGTNTTQLATTAFSAQLSRVGATNTKASLTAAGASLTVSASEVVCETTGGSGVKLGSFSQTVNLSTTGAGGMDTGTAPASGFVSIYAIWGSAGTSIMACAVAASTAEVYGGANLPSGYTHSALLAVWPTNSSSQFKVGAQRGRRFYHADTISDITSVVSAGTATTATAVSAAAFVPACAVEMTLHFTTSIAADNTVVESDTSGIGYCNTGKDAWADHTLPVITASTFYYYIYSRSTGVSYIDVVGYSI